MRITLLALVLTVALGTAFATTSSELVLSNSSNTVTCTISASGLSGNGCSGLTLGTNTFVGSNIVIDDGTFTIGTAVWNLSVVGATSYTPNALQGVDLNSDTATCVSGACINSTLLIFFSDIGFTTPASSFTDSVGGSLTGSGSVQQRGWVSATNNLLALTSQIGGTLGPFSAPPANYSGSASGAATEGPAAYSMTLEQEFMSDAQADTFSADGQLTANVNVPEPMSLLLLGGCLLVVGRKLAARLA
jgi:hypothetical protein